MKLVNFQSKLLVSVLLGVFISLYIAPNFAFGYDWTEIDKENSVKKTECKIGQLYNKSDTERWRILWDEQNEVCYAKEPYGDEEKPLDEYQRIVIKENDSTPVTESPLDYKECDYGFLGITDFFSGLACSFATGFKNSVMLTSTVWLSKPTDLFKYGMINLVAPDYSELDLTASGSFGQIIGIVKGVGIMALVITLIFWGYRIMFKHDEFNQKAKMFDQLAMIMTSVGLVGAMTTIVTTVMQPMDLVLVYDNVSSWLTGALMPYLILILVVSSIITVVRGIRNYEMDGIRAMADRFFQLFVVISFGATGYILLAQMGDDFSLWFMNQTSKATELIGWDKGLSDFVSDIAMLGNLPWIIVFSIIGLLLSGIQILLLMFRTYVAVILLGILPIAVAASGFRNARDMFPKTLGWLIAVLLYKPAAAIVYGMTNIFYDLVVKDDPWGAFWVALFALLLVTFGLGFLVKLVAPQVGAMADNFSMAGHAISGAATLATGAVLVAATGGMAAPIAAGGAIAGGGSTAGASGIAGGAATTAAGTRAGASVVGGTGITSRSSATESGTAAGGAIAGGGSTAGASGIAGGAATTAAGTRAGASVVGGTGITSRSSATESGTAAGGATTAAADAGAGASVTGGTGIPSGSSTVESGIASGETKTTTPSAGQSIGTETSVNDGAVENSAIDQTEAQIGTLTPPSPTGAASMSTNQSNEPGANATTPTKTTSKKQTSKPDDSSSNPNAAEPTGADSTAQTSNQTVAPANSEPLTASGADTTAETTAQPAQNATGATENENGPGTKDDSVGSESRRMSKLMMSQGAGALSSNTGGMAKNQMSHPDAGGFKGSTISPVGLAGNAASGQQKTKQGDTQSTQETISENETVSASGGNINAKGVNSTPEASTVNQGNNTPDDNTEAQGGEFSPLAEPERVIDTETVIETRERIVNKEKTITADGAIHETEKPQGGENA